MTDYDPFASAPADEAQAPAAPTAEASVFDAPPAEAPAPAPAKKAPAKKAAPKAAAAESEEGKVVLTFKGGTGFDAPWIVIHATSLDDALEQVSGENSTTLAAIMERTQTAGQHFVKLGGGSSNGGGGQRPQRQAAPRPAQEPPANAPAKPGDGWEYRTGTTRSGRNAGQTWQAWMPPQGSNERPVFF